MVTSRFHTGRICISSPPCRLSRCPHSPRPCTATWKPWSPCCPPENWATRVGWCRSSVGRADWAHSCRTAWRGEPWKQKTGCVLCQGGKCDRWCRVIWVCFYSRKSSAMFCWMHGCVYVAVHYNSSTVQIGHKDFKLVLCQEYFISSAVHKALQPHTNHLCVQKYIEKSTKYQRHMLNLVLHHYRRKSGVYRFNQSNKWVWECVLIQFNIHYTCSLN